MPVRSRCAACASLADALKAEGLSMPKLKVATDGLESVVYRPEDIETSGVAEIIGGAGYLVGAYDNAFEMTKRVSDLFGEVPDLGKAAKVVDALGKVGGVLSVSSGMYSGSQYYDMHPELPEDRRVNNMAAETDLRTAISFFGVIPPAEDWLNERLYVDKDEAGLSRAERFYNFRYELVGKYGM